MKITLVFLALFNAILLVGCDRHQSSASAAPPTAPQPKTEQDLRWEAKFPKTTFNKRLTLQEKALFKAELRDKSPIYRELVLLLTINPGTKIGFPRSRGGGGPVDLHNANGTPTGIATPLYSWSDTDSNWQEVAGHLESISKAPEFEPSPTPIQVDVHALLDYGPAAGILGGPRSPDKLRVAVFAQAQEDGHQEAAYVDVSVEREREKKREDLFPTVKSIFGTAADHGKDYGKGGIFTPTITNMPKMSLTDKDGKEIGTMSFEDLFADPKEPDSKPVQK